MKSLVVGPNAIMAKGTANLADIFNSTNCLCVYETEGQYRHWTPGGSLNPISTIAAGKGYIAIMKTVLDVSTYFAASTDIGVGAILLVVNKSLTDNITISYTGSTGPVTHTVNSGVTYVLPKSTYPANTTNVSAVFAGTKTFLELQTSVDGSASGINEFNDDDLTSGKNLDSGMDLTKNSILVILDPAS